MIGRFRATTKEGKKRRERTVAARTLVQECCASVHMGEWIHTYGRGAKSLLPVGYGSDGTLAQPNDVADVLANTVHELTANLGKHAVNLHTMQSELVDAYYWLGARTAMCTETMSPLLMVVLMPRSLPSRQHRHTVR